MTRRYFVPDLPKSEGDIDLPSDEAYHAARVMRVRSGESVVLFDGRGREVEATIIEVGKRSVRVSMGNPRIVSREVGFSILVACPLPKGDRAKWLVEKLTELGVAALCPLETERTQGNQGNADTQLEKLRRTVVEACKQCERNWLMEILARELFSTLVTKALEPGLTISPGEEFVDKPALVHRLLLHPRAPITLGEQIVTAGLREESSSQGSSLRPRMIVAAGPEGGFSESELQFAVGHGWVPVSLGESILRIETAIMAAVARLVLA